MPRSMIVVGYQWVSDYIYSVCFRQVSYTAKLGFKTLAEVRASSLGVGACFEQL